MQRKNAVWVATLFSLMLAGNANAMFGDDEARKAILELREKLNASNDAQVKLRQSMDGLQNANAQLLGQIEELRNVIHRQQDDMRRYYQDLENRIKPLEPEEILLPDGKVYVASAEERRLIGLADDLFAKQDYVRSAALYEQVALLYPTSDYAPWAQSKAGSACYIAEDLDCAIRALTPIKALDIAHEVRPNALMTLAAAQLAAKKRDEAIAVWSLVQKDYPGSELAEDAKKRVNAIQPKKKSVAKKTTSPKKTEPVKKADSVKKTTEEKKVEHVQKESTIQKVETTKTVVTPTRETSQSTQAIEEVANKVRKEESEANVKKSVDAGEENTVIAPQPVPFSN